MSNKNPPPLLHVCKYELHSGVVSKRNSLDEMIELADKKDWQELDDLKDESLKNFLHECSINLCAEDVWNIFNSTGLIGIKLDKKRIAGKEIIKIIQNKENKNEDEKNLLYAKAANNRYFFIFKISITTQ